MKVMSLDLELNQLNDSPKIIEVGAAIYDSRNGKLIDSFHSYVNPNEVIMSEITELTGITDEMVRLAPTVKEVYVKLQKFHEQHRPFQNPIVWGSGTRNDSYSLWLEANPNEPNFMGHRVIDAKTVFQSFQLFTNKKIRAGLSSAMKEMDLSWDDQFGLPHRALADAHNTARIWFHMMNEFCRASVHIKKIKSLLRAE